MVSFTLSVENLSFINKIKFSINKSFSCMCIFRNLHQGFKEHKL